MKVFSVCVEPASSEPIRIEDLRATHEDCGNLEILIGDDRYLLSCSNCGKMVEIPSLKALAAAASAGTPCNFSKVTIKPKTQQRDLILV